MSNLRDDLILFLEDFIELTDGEFDVRDFQTFTKRANDLLEILEDQRDGYGTRAWDED